MRHTALRKHQVPAHINDFIHMLIRYWTLILTVPTGRASPQLFLGDDAADQVQLPADYPAILAQTPWQAPKEISK